MNVSTKSVAEVSKRLLTWSKMWEITKYQAPALQLSCLTPHQFRSSAGKWSKADHISSIWVY